MASSHQKGFALAAAMMVLALLSVLGAAAIQSTTLEVKISYRDRDARAALYVAESAVEEARYYASRGWGKITDFPGSQVQVSTVTPPPPNFWSDSRYSGFTLFDEDGNAFRVDSHTSALNPVITYSGGPPDPPRSGRFVIVRDIPDAVPGTTVNWTAPNLVISNPDPSWVWDDKAQSNPNAWRDWLLWNADGQSYPVLGSSGSVASNEVRLQLDADPGPGPYTLAINPWLAALASGAGVPEDTDADPSAWDRDFDGIGEGRVTARFDEDDPTSPYFHTYEITAVGIMTQGGVTRQREVAVRVYNAGRSDQRVGDWKVVR